MYNLTPEKLCIRDRAPACSMCKSYHISNHTLGMMVMAPPKQELIRDSNSNNLCEECIRLKKKIADLLIAEEDYKNIIQNLTSDIHRLNRLSIETKLDISKVKSDNKEILERKELEIARLRQEYEPINTLLKDKGLTLGHVLAYIEDNKPSKVKDKDKNKDKETKKPKIGVKKN